jgi:hypothetical protein
LPWRLRDTASIPLQWLYPTLQFYLPPLNMSAGPWLLLIHLVLFCWGSPLYMMVIFLCYGKILLYGLSFHKHDRSRPWTYSPEAYVGCYIINNTAGMKMIGVFDVLPESVKTLVSNRFVGPSHFCPLSSLPGWVRKPSLTF